MIPHSKRYCQWHEKEQMLSKIQEVGGRLSSGRNDYGTLMNARPAIPVESPSAIFNNNTKHATDNDTDVNPNKQKSPKLPKKIPLKYQGYF